jgi:hypothetical protein
MSELQIFGLESVEMEVEHIVKALDESYYHTFTTMKTFYELQKLVRLVCEKQGYTAVDDFVEHADLDVVKLRSVTFMSREVFDARRSGINEENIPLTAPALTWGAQILDTKDIFE